MIYDILARKRDGEKNSPKEIESLIRGFVTGGAADYQMSAWLMAVCINGMDGEETAALTQAMVSSGGVIDLSSIGGRTVDKHSTGGIGDKTTLVLAPLLASSGLTVAKMSGRGLGITGGTLDKLESIPGFRTDLAMEEFLHQAESIGCVVAGQTPELVPADRLMYALRDVTATVESIPLIAASIMSKKIACGAQTILLDVKVGSGAFMQDVSSARKLAETMIQIGNNLGRRTIAVISSMDQPLGRAVGNAIEVAEAIETLEGGGADDLRELVLELAAALATASGFFSSRGEAEKKMTSLLDSGLALAKFREMVVAQGGDLDADPPHASYSRSITSDTTGFVAALDARKIGRAAGALGTGRIRKEDRVDPTAGVCLEKKIGDRVQAGDEIATIYSNSSNGLDEAARLVESAFQISDKEPRRAPLILKRLGF